MKSLFLACLLVLCACGDQHTPVTGIYDLTTNAVTHDTPAGCATGMASPMTLQITQASGTYSLFICGAVGAPCDQQYLYATSNDGYSFAGGTGGMAANFDIAYDTKLATHVTTISGTGVTSLGPCTWDTTYNGTKR